MIKIAAIYLVLISNVVYGQLTLKEFELSGNVKTVSQLQFVYNALDSNFNILSNNFTNNIHLIFNVSEYCFRINYVESDTIERYKEFVYDESNRLVQSYFLMKDDIFHYVLDSISYKNEGRIIEKNRKTGTKKKYLISIDSLDEDFNLAERRLYKNAILNSKIIIIRTDSSIRYLDYLKDDKKSGESIVKLNSLGQKVEQITYSWGRIIYHAKFEYNLNGFISKKTTYDNGKVNEVFENKYIYDKNGNWIRKIEIQNGSQKYLTIRLIDYF